MWVRMATVRELEQELNVSRVSIYALLKKEPYKAHVLKGRKKGIAVDEKGAELLRRYYRNKIRGGEPRRNTLAGVDGNGDGLGGVDGGGSADGHAVGAGTGNGTGSSAGTGKTGNGAGNLNAGGNGVVSGAEQCANGASGMGCHPVAGQISAIGILQQQLAVKDEQINSLLGLLKQQAVKAESLPVP